MRQMLAVYVATTLFLQHKSTKPVLSAAQMVHIWDRVDHSLSGLLDIEGVNAVLLRVGDRGRHRAVFIISTT